MTRKNVSATGFLTLVLALAVSLGVPGLAWADQFVSNGNFSAYTTGANGVGELANYTTITGWNANVNDSSYLFKAGTDQSYKSYNSSYVHLWAPSNGSSNGFSPSSSPLGSNCVASDNWRFHAVHHSAEEMDFLVNTRAHPFDMVFVGLCGLVPIFVLGLSGPMGLEGSRVALISSLIGTIWGFFIHANLRWRFGPLEWLVATPAFHHWHHTRSGPIDKNYAANLPWVDRIFGTLYLPKSWPKAYGIKAPMPDSLAEQLVHPIYPSTPASVPTSPEAEDRSHRPELVAQG